MPMPPKVWIGEHWYLVRLFNPRTHEVQLLSRRGIVFWAPLSAISITEPLNGF